MTVNLKILMCIYGYCLHHVSGNVDPTWFLIGELHYLGSLFIVQKYKVCKDACF